MRRRLQRVDDPTGDGVEALTNVRPHPAQCVVSPRLGVEENLNLMPVSRDGCRRASTTPAMLCMAMLLQGWCGDGGA